MARASTGLACALLALLAPAVSRADPAADFYRGKRVNFYIGSTVGGSYDFYARLIARHLPRHLPGNPAIVARNMPGASSLIAANFIGNVAARDGTAVGVINSAAPFQQLFGVEAARFDAPGANWLPSPSGFSALLVVASHAPAKTFADLRDHEVLMATLSPGSTPGFYAAVFNDLFKLKLKAITGHPGMPEAYLAMQRGEIDGFPSTPWLSLLRNYADLMEQKKLRLLLQYGPARIAELPDVPFAADLTTNEEDRRLLDLAMAPLVLGFPYLMPPGVPQERVAAMRKAMMDTMKDEAFLADAAKQTLDIAPVTGEESQRIVQAAYASPPAVIARVQRIYGSQAK